MKGVEDAGSVEEDKPSEKQDEQAVGGVFVFDGGCDGKTGGDEREAGSENPEMVAGEVVGDERGEESNVEEVLNSEDDHGDSKEETSGHERVLTAGSGGETVENEGGGGEAEALEEEGAAVGVVGYVVDVCEIEAGSAKQKEA